MSEQEVCTLAYAEVQEVSGDMFQVIGSGPVKVIWKPGYSKVAGALTVGDFTFDFRLDSPNGPYRKVDSRTFHFSTDDVMGFYYLSFAKGTSEYDLAKAELVFKQLALRNKPILPQDPIPGAGEADAAIQDAIDHDNTKQAAAQAGIPVNQVGGFFQAIAKRAAEDTAKLQEIAQKAGADTLLLGGLGAKAIGDAFQQKPPGGAPPSQADPKPAHSAQ